MYYDTDSVEEQKLQVNLNVIQHNHSKNTRNEELKMKMKEDVDRTKAGSSNEAVRDTPPTSKEVGIGQKETLIDSV